MEFTIEENITKPKPVRSSTGRTPKYSFHKLVKIGQSFKVAYNTEDKKERENIVRSVRQAVGAFKKKNPTVALSTVNVLGTNPQEEGIDGLRVFRDAPKEKDTTPEATV